MNKNTEIHDHALYIITRADLTPGEQIAQIAHATAKFCLNNPTLAKIWYEENEYMICLEAPDEAALEALLVRAANEIDDLEYNPAIYREPDMDNAITAIALAPCEETRRLVSNLPLAGRTATSRLTVIKIVEDLQEHIPMVEVCGDAMSIPFEGANGMLTLEVGPRKYRYSYHPWHELGIVKPEDRTDETFLHHEGRGADAMRAWLEFGPELKRRLEAPKLCLPQLTV